MISLNVGVGKKERGKRGRGVFSPLTALTTMENPTFKDISGIGGQWQHVNISFSISTSGSEEDRAPEVQLLHVRERPGARPHGQEGQLQAQHHPHLPPGQRRQASR